MRAKVTVDKSRANIAALELINKSLESENKIDVRQIKYLNNIVEQDHRFIKKMTKPMKGHRQLNSKKTNYVWLPKF